MAKIKNIRAREILDSRGQPTVEATVVLDNGLTATASAPSGFSLSPYEGRERRDHDSRRYNGQGVRQAVKKIEEIITPALANQPVTDQIALDKRLAELDGTPDRRNLGTNGLWPVSAALARAAALSKKQELYVYLRETYDLGAPRIPVPIFNFFSGGAPAETNLDFQEFLFLPKSAAAAEMIRAGAEVWRELGEVLAEAGYDTAGGNWGGYAPALDSSLEALELIIAAGLRTGRKAGRDFQLGLNIGAALLYDQNSGKYVFSLDQAYFHSATLSGLYEEWLKKYPLAYLEDALAAEAWSDWRDLTAQLGRKIIIAGGDLFATQTARLRQGLKEQAANAIIIKPNSAGTLTAAMECLQLARKHGYKIILAGRSGETNDDFIADLAVAAGADYFKAGSLSRGERVGKYNRLMAIADNLETK